ncbi:MAG: hypothetical protein RBS91_08205 [Sulfurimonadaceae bacterium]|jgi:hypothetical protein|nr:hypothetical protein [Sulfurimonadaceae bacterium]
MHGITSLGNIKKAIDIYKNSGGCMDNVPIGRFVYVSTSNAKAKQELWPVILKLTQRLKSIGLKKAGQDNSR